MGWTAETEVVMVVVVEETPRRALGGGLNVVNACFKLQPCLLDPSTFAPSIDVLPLESDKQCRADIKNCDIIDNQERHAHRTLQLRIHH